MVTNHEQESAQTVSIPVLDELVEADTTSITEPASTAQPAYSTDQLMQLVDNLENKLNGELEMLINVIKGNMKETIIEEIRSQMEVSHDEISQKSDEHENDRNNEEEDLSLHQDGYRPYGQDDDI